MPVQYLAPYAPGRDGPWDARLAAHLLRRAGFGSPREEVEEAAARGLDRTVQSLFDEAADEEAEFQQTFDRIFGLLDLSDLGDLQAWWCHRMIRTRAPLREKLTLFWHGHFATSYHKVGDTHLMHRQIETLRRLAWGSVTDLTLAIAKDPAMVVYLDGESNTQEHPNENFARELMELFTCGIGHYTEQDVLEGARAFTGWHRDGAEFWFNADAHDTGVKTFLGQTGRFDGGDIVEMLMKQPATLRFIARKLLRFFATPDPDDAVVVEAASTLSRTRLNIKALVRELFASRYFYSADCIRARIASPVELVIGTARTLGCQLPARTLKDHLVAMGQELFAPPNVKGWDGEQMWINSSTWAARVAFAQAVSELRGYGKFDPNLPLDRLAPPEATDPRAVADALVGLLMQGEVASSLRREIAQLLVTASDGQQPGRFRDDEEFRAAQIRRTVAAILSLPEYQRC